LSPSHPCSHSSPCFPYTTLFRSQPESVRLVEPAAAGLSPSATAVRTLIISEQARRYLALQYRSFPTEFMGCMIGEVHGATRCTIDRKSTRLNRSHVAILYAVLCL